MIVIKKKIVGRNTLFILASGLIKKGLYFESKKFKLALFSFLFFIAGEDIN